MRASTRCAMVERASPVIAASSPRVLARPVRTRSRMAPADPLEADAVGVGDTESDADLMVTST